jgi:hypothetical protein
MAEIEKLHKYFENESDKDLNKKCREICEDIDRKWDEFKRCQLFLHGEIVKGGDIYKLVYYLVKRGVL